MNSSSGTNPSRWPLLLLCSLSVSLGACSTVKNLFSRTKVQPSSFLTHAGELKEDRKRSPFIGNWWSTDKEVLAAAEKRRQIYVAPVVHENIRPDRTVVSRVEHDAGWRRRHLPALAEYTRDKFVDAFRNSKSPRYAVADAPGRDALTLELSLLEWAPNTYTGLLIREVVGMLTFHLVGGAVMKNTRGFMAIEGRLVEPRSRQPVFEFADKEYGKIVLILPLQELRRNGQSHFAIKQWATQLEKLLRAKPGERVKDSWSFVLVNF